MGVAKLRLASQSEGTIEVVYIGPMPERNRNPPGCDDVTSGPGAMSRPDRWPDRWFVSPRRIR